MCGLILYWCATCRTGTRNEHRPQIHAIIHVWKIKTPQKFITITQIGKKVKLIKCGFKRLKNPMMFISMLLLLSILKRMWAWWCLILVDIMILCNGFVSSVVLSLFCLFDYIMKLFFAGLVVATVGFSGIANILNIGLNIVQTHTQQLNAQLEQIKN